MAPKTQRTVVLRCYARPIRDGFVAVCVDLGLAVERPTRHAAIRELEQQIRGYVEAVMKRGWVDELVPRRTRWSYLLQYFALRLQLAVAGAVATVKTTRRPTVWEVPAAA